MIGYPLCYYVIVHFEKSSLSFDSAVYGGFVPDVLKAADFFSASFFVYFPLRL